MDIDAILQAIKDRKVPQGKKSAGEYRLVVNAAGTEASLYLYDEISWWTYNDADSFRQKLAALKVDTIHVHINSPGGSVFDGVAIYNMLMAHPAKVITHNDGLAASIASVIFLSGEERKMAENAMVMIHEPWTVGIGNASEMRKTADTLDAISEAILNTYESRTEMPRGDLAAAMTAETWYGVGDSVTKGFATEKVASQKVAALWKAADFAYLPEAAKAFGVISDQSAVISGEGEEEEKVVEYGDVDEVKAARERMAKLVKKLEVGR